MNENMKLVLANARKLDIVNNQSKTVLEDIVKYCQTQVAVLRKQQSELNGKIVQLMLMENVIHGILKSHINQKMESEKLDKNVEKNAFVQKHSEAIEKLSEKELDEFEKILDANDLVQALSFLNNVKTPKKKIAANKRRR